MVKVFSCLHEWQNFREHNSLSLGFVPTMGALHEGHFSLIRRSQAENQQTLVSIFVNPTQFNDPQDFENYPQCLETDLAKLRQLKVDFVLAPSAASLYPNQYTYKVREDHMSLQLCGRSRPGHFEGVLTIVLKLLNLVEAKKAYFGEKDYQQFKLIEGMVEAFFLKTKIIPCSTQRESDGLAMSSRNVLLNPSDRQKAPLFYKALSSFADLQNVRHTLLESGFEIDYLEELNGRRYGAVKLGGVRLIDNVPISDLQEVYDVARH